MSHLLRIVDVRKEYGAGRHAVRALDGVTLDVDAGEFVALMGASGSGKSTLLHLIGALDVPTAGRIEIEGRDPASMNDHDRTLFRRERIGIVFQAFNLLPTLTAAENVALPLIIAGEARRAARARAAELLDSVDLSHRSGHRPEAMSGGEQQRVAFARALINAPAVLLADEPTGNLDTKHADEIWRLLRRFCTERSKTVVAVTHEASGASFADRVAVLKDGRMVGEIQPDGEDHASLVAARYQELAG